MSLFNRKTSFIVLTYEDSLSRDELVSKIKSYPYKNIVGKSDLQHVSYRTGRGEEFPYLVESDRYIYISEESQTKVLPHKKINKKIEEVRLSKYPDMKLRDFNDDYKPALLLEFQEEESPYCSVRTSITDIIIDTRDRVIYLEHKSDTKATMTSYLLQSKLEFDEVRMTGRISPKVAIEYPALKTELLNELFLYWVYKKASSELVGDLHIDLNAKLKDNLSKIDIRGEVQRFTDVFETLNHGRGIKEMTLILPCKDELNMNQYEFTINTKTFAVRNFVHKDVGRRSLCVSSVSDKVTVFKEINTYINKLYFKFQKDLLRVGIEDLYNDLRGNDKSDS